MGTESFWNKCFVFLEKKKVNFRFLSLNFQDIFFKKISQLIYKFGHKKDSFCLQFHQDIFNVVLIIRISFCPHWRLILYYSTRNIVLGDHLQLPSVDPGNFMADLHSALKQKGWFPPFVIYWTYFRSFLPKYLKDKF